MSEDLSVKTPIIYPGGKSLLLPEIMPLIPPHKSTIDLFGGGASFILLDKFKFGVYNDVNRYVYNFFRVLQGDKAPELIRRLKYTPYSRDFYNDTFIEESSEFDELELAYRFFVQTSLAFTHELHNHSFRVGQPGGPESYKRHIDNLDVISEKLRSIVIENLDFRRCMSIYGNYPDSLIFADPPYITDTANTLQYQHMMTYSDHVQLLEILNDSPADVILCGYKSELYESVLKPPIWQLKKKIRNAGVGNSAYKDRDDRVEHIWTKFRERGLWS